MPASCAMRSSSRVSVGGGYFWRPASCAMRSSTPSPVDSMPSAFRVAASTPCSGIENSMPSASCSPPAPGRLATAAVEGPAAGGSVGETSMPHSLAECTGAACSAARRAASAAAFAASASGLLAVFCHSCCRVPHSAFTHPGFGLISIVGKKSLRLEYPRYFPTIPKSSRYLSVFWTRSPAMMPIVVGRLAAHTPSRLSVFSSMPDATTSGGTHWKHAVSPGASSCMWPDTASSLTPLSIHVCPSSRHTWLMVMRAS
mmetsp:Transcript_9614/g.29145  ORF Transcript_9614/g.29145 Transcript_9614/m.29145 type:complete len:257 (-) Transcript_9614:681-1451(-)